MWVLLLTNSRRLLKQCCGSATELLRETNHSKALNSSKTASYSQLETGLAQLLSSPVDLGFRGNSYV